MTVVVLAVILDHQAELQGNWIPENYRIATPALACIIL